VVAAHSLISRKEDQVQLHDIARYQLAGSAVFIGLWATGTEFNVTAMMGVTMIVGIVTEVAIFYFL
jgi:hypothetical protein